MKSVTCLRCGWVHFEVSADYVREWKREWVNFWNESTIETRESYGCLEGPPSESQYLKCFNCGTTYTNFRDSVSGDMRDGSTIQPILNRKETL